MNELDILRRADFEWVVHHEDVWSLPASDVADLHADLRAAFTRKLEDMEQAQRAGSPLGWVVVGTGGAGKTHLLGAFRREATRRRHPFIMVDLTDVRVFWESVLQGYVHSLQQRLEEDMPQYRWVLGNIIQKLGPSKPVSRILETLADHKSTDLKADMNKVLTAMNQVWPKETMKYQNVIRAVICMNSDDFSITNLGQTWLQGQALEPEDKRALGFTVERESPKAIIEALSWFMSLSGPTVLAFDQLDPIVTQLHFRKHGDPSTEEQAAAQAIIADIGGGLGSLRDFTRNTLTLVSCLEPTWAYLLETTLRTFLDRFEPTRTLKPLGSAERARAVAEGRLARAFRTAGFKAPHPSYPFRPEAFAALTDSSPREVLKRCKARLDEMLLKGAVDEIDDLVASPNRPVGPLKPSTDGRLDREFEALRSQARPAWILEEKHDDERLAPLIRSGLTCLIHEAPEAADVHATVEDQFTGGAKTAPLHARLRRIFHKEQDREEHFCVRAIQHSNAKAYQSQLTSALTTSGIDTRLSRFRRLTVIRSIDPPGGAKTAEMTTRFQSLGGVFVRPSEDDLRTLHALHDLRTRNDPEFLLWLKGRGLASKLPLLREIVGEGFWKSTPEKPAEARTNGEPAAASPAVEKPPVEESTPPPSEVIPLGRRVVGESLGTPFGLPVKLLEKHTLVIAGAGSGKTVFLKRMVEEAALAGVPSIVVDCANDLAALDERWGTPPEAWANGDAGKADRFHVPGRVVVWTPNRPDGNPLWFDPLPDLAALADDPNELSDALEGVRESLAPVVAKGTGQASTNKAGVLAGALNYMARHGGGGIDVLIELLKDLPAEAETGISTQHKLAVQMADALIAERATNPLLQTRGTPLDPALLFGPSRLADPARVSVVSLVGLPGLEAQRRFVNQLAMTLFAWIKKNPDPGDRPLRGLLVVDEARDFIPANKTSTCRESLLRLGAQARKYHLGLVFATQNPKDVDNRLVANCSTHVYGKVNSMAAIETVRDLIRQKGGVGEDVPKLPAGRFYVHNADAGIPAPLRIQTSFCLSRHPSNPLDEATVIAKAARARRG